ncbi:Uu.00g104870.m01.CDS01 [Anthostomella pinea]|uniref:Uu.00g104870.m01.CDS01 n=1 Tax=Anthostomella pinea TaxID=933095 RepID=A0AAI8VDW5_9PEZI|nr:Uu.00g104870.m01.CDS01 [Anthostomella pinea]
MAHQDREDQQEVHRGDILEADIVPSNAFQYVDSIQHRYALSTETKDKSPLHVQDLAILLNNHWSRDTEIFPHERFRLQPAMMLIIGAATSSRPTTIRMIGYQDLTFSLFPNGTGRSYLTVKLRLQNTKKGGDRKLPAAYGFREETNLLYCPVIGMIALAIADGAFQGGINSLEKIYSLRVRPSDEWRNRFIFAT